MNDVLDVLIVGAGPTGLVLALWLRRAGIDVRVIDKALEPGTTSRALVLHARTLELYRQLGLAADVVARALPFTAVNLWAHGRHVAHAELGALGQDLTPYPEMLIFPQDEHERLLVEHLRRAGVEIERGTELTGLEPLADRVRTSLRRHDGAAEMSYEARFVAGCDGAHSAVRERLGVGFPGGTYERRFYVADVNLAGPADDPSVHELHLAIDEADFLGIFPLAGENRARLIGAVKPEAAGRPELTWADVAPKAIERMSLDVRRVSWFSTYRVHHRVAERFRSRRVFLLGDAAHVHSPVGGQGMNTGIGDAANLAWKLADVLHGRVADPDALLDSYEAERVGFARRLVATTDRAFTFVSRDGWLARWVRTTVVPRLLPGLVRREAVRRFMFRTLSQTAINYRRSVLSQGRAGRVRGGDRLPWVSCVDNYAPLGKVEWQVHIYGEPTAPADWTQALAAWGVPVHVFPWRADMGSAGFARGATYLVRPDGYVAVADPGSGAILAFLEGLRRDARAPGSSGVFEPVMARREGARRAEVRIRAIRGSHELAW